jgi:hypothetical protein
MSALKELAVKHPYYCSDSNYYSNTPNETYDTMTDFLDCFEQMDIDLNLCFRWDIKEVLDDDENPTGEYRAEVFLILQRKGIFKPCMIESVSESEASRFKDYALRHFEVLKAIWAPLSGSGA